MTPRDIFNPYWYHFWIVAPLMVLKEGIDYEGACTYILISLICDNSIEYSGRYAISDNWITKQHEKRCIPPARVNSSRNYKSFAANQYLMLENFNRNNL